MVEIEIPKQYKKTLEIIEKKYKNYPQFYTSELELALWINDLDSHKDVTTEIKKLRNDILQFFINTILPYIKNNPGVLQRDINSEFTIHIRRLLESFFKQSEKIGVIGRSKSESSYKLYLIREIKTPKGLFTKIQDIYHDSIKKIGIYLYLNGCNKLKDYFGESTVEKIKRNSDDIAFSKFSSAFTSPGASFVVKPLSGNEIKNKNFFSLLNEGSCFRFEMNEDLENVINKYWTEECDSELRKFLSKYGFLSEKTFVFSRLDEILGKERTSEFKHELQAKSSFFKIRCCILDKPSNEILSLNSCYKLIPSDLVLAYYAESLKYKWALKPDIQIKQCKYCGKNFIPILPDYSTKKIESIVKFYPIKKSINEINLCAKHFPPQKHFDDKFLINLKNLADYIGFIPPYNYHDDYSYLKGLELNKFEKAIMMLNQLPSYSSPSETNLNRRDTDHLAIKDVFGSWLHVLAEADILEGGVRKTPRGYMCLAIDGHECRSLGEKNVDDWLYRHSIPHEKEVRYPGKRAFRADWKVGDYFIEFWGLRGEEDYDKKMEVKTELAKQYSIPLISLNQQDLPILDFRLEKLIEEYGGQKWPTYDTKIQNCE